MIKRNKVKLILSCVVILLPILFGIIFWNKLPEQITTHWGFDGVADGNSSRVFAIFGLPVILLIIQWICVLFTSKDPKNKDQNQKAFGMVLWIMPIMSLFVNALMYAVAFGKEMNLYFAVPFSLGLMFVFVGNYLPKCKQNYTIGIKIKWTLENEENWNATHRFGGKVWVAGGILILFCSFLPEKLMPFVLTVPMTVLVLLPIFYSYRYHKKQLKEGEPVITPIVTTKREKIFVAISMTLVTALLVGIGIVTFTGDIDVKYDETSFTIVASYWDDLTVNYDIIDNIEYRETDDKGMRTNGFGGARLQAGAFRNEEFGNYTRYSYVKCDECVVITAGEKILVINGVNAESTKAIYENLKTKTDR